MLWLIQPQPKQQPVVIQQQQPQQQQQQQQQPVVLQQQQQQQQPQQQQAPMQQHFHIADEDSEEGTNPDISPPRSNESTRAPDSPTRYAEQFANLDRRPVLQPARTPPVSDSPLPPTPTYFIQGHDGSFTKLYGTYNPNTGILVDFRDQALLEFEQRIYNNLKLSTSVPINEYEILPGYFRQSESTYTYDEFLEMYSSAFLNWVGQNRLDYKTQYFSKTNEFTYNYTNSGNKLNQTAIQQGYWRGIYIYFYDTSTPNLTPWEMLG